MQLKQLRHFRYPRSYEGWCTPHKPLPDNFYKSIVDKMFDGVVLIRAEEHLIIYSNHSFNKMFGYHEGELTGRHVSILNFGTEKTAPGETTNQIKTALEQENELADEDILTVTLQSVMIAA